MHIPSPLSNSVSDGISFSSPTVYVSHKGCTHDAKKPIIIAGHPVWLAAQAALEWETVKQMDLILPLNGSMPKAAWGARLNIVNCALQDYGGVPEIWPQFIKAMAEQITKGRKVLAYCVGSHGRTGCFAASLIALMEPDIEDPIDEIRKRHCLHAVESQKQAEAIFAIKGTKLPDKHKFSAPSYSGWSNSSSNSSSTYTSNPTFIKIPNYYTYVITDISKFGAYTQYIVSRAIPENTKATRLFFVGKPESTYEVGQYVKLKED